MATILIVEDDTLLNKGVSVALKKEGYTVMTAYTCSKAEIILNENSINLILLDINLPDKSGLEFCEEIRKKSSIPIIFLTANDTENDMISGFKTGCDDYISKPFSLELLKQRVRAILRRVSLNSENNEIRNTVVFGDLEMDFDKKSVNRKGEQLSLTAIEYKLLELIVKNKNQVMTRQIILEKLWDSSGNFVDENTLSVNIRRLRKKIEDDPQAPKHIITVFGIGYTWGDSVEN